MMLLLAIFQILCAIFLIILIALQGKGSGLGGNILGASNQIYHTRKGVDKFLFRLTILTGALFIVSSIVRILI